MSQDLFAAFNEPVQAQRPSPTSWITPQDHTAVPAAVIEDEDDDFGDFEDASVSTAAPVVPAKDKPVAAAARQAVPLKRDPSAKLPFEPKPAAPAKAQQGTGRHPFADHMDVLFDAGEGEYDAGQDEWNDLSNDPEAAMAYSKKVIQEQLDAEARKAGGSVATSKAKPLPFSLKPKNLDVLFDADEPSEGEDGDTEADDGWGDFEQTAQPEAFSNKQLAPTVQAVEKKSLPSIDLLGLDDSTPPPTGRQGASAPASQIKKALSSQQVRSMQPATTEESWDDFDDSPSGPASTTHDTTKALQSLTAPTNVPPPSVLLSHLAVSLKVSPTTDNVSELLLHAWILGHVLAGRKLRWKRSSTLAASMRIGPAAAGGKSGMKLTGVDRGEVTKEEREVAEALATWRALVGKLRPIAAHATSSQRSDRRVPELAETMPVKSLKAVDGGFVAPRECALCGLKREERSGKLDEDVQDSFGEWWHDNASMHNACAGWWVSNEVLLRSR